MKQKAQLFSVIRFRKSMQSLRGNLANIPNALSSLIGTVTSPIDGTDFAVSSSPTFDNDTLASVSGDDSSDKSHAIPNGLIKEEWQLVLDQDASVDDLTNAIEKCKELVLRTDECSTERKWLVRHLVELRFRLREMEDANIDHSKTGASYRVSQSFINNAMQFTCENIQLCIPDYSRTSLC